MSKFIKMAALAFAAGITFAQAASAANTYVLTDGSAQVNFSTNALQSFQSAGIGVSAIAPASYTAPSISFSASANGIGYGSGNLINSLTADGGLRLASSTVTGARIDLTNIKVDATTGNVFADGVTQSWTNATLGSYTGTSFKNQQLFTSTLSGSADIAAGNGNITLSLADLHFASSAIPVLGNALGVPSFLQTLIFPSLNVGNVTVNAAFKLQSATSVPEPATWGLMCLGLFGTVAASRRRAA